MLIPFVFELLQGPLLVIPQAMASRTLPPSFIKLRTLVRGLRHQSSRVRLMPHPSHRTDFPLNKMRNITVNKGINKLILRGQMKVNALLHAAATVLPCS